MVVTGQMVVVREIVAVVTVKEAETVPEEVRYGQLVTVGAQL